MDPSKLLSFTEKRNRFIKKADTVYIFDPRVHMNLTKLEKENLDQIVAYEKMQWMTEVAKLKTGQSFGELALINNEPRKATIMCLNDCYLAVLEQKDYSKVL